MYMLDKRSIRNDVMYIEHHCNIAKFLMQVRRYAMSIIERGVAMFFISISFVVWH